FPSGLLRKPASVAPGDEATMFPSGLLRKPASVASADEATMFPSGLLRKPAQVARDGEPPPAHGGVEPLRPPAPAVPLPITNATPSAGNAIPQPIPHKIQSSPVHAVDHSSAEDEPAMPGSANASGEIPATPRGPKPSQATSLLPHDQKFPVPDSRS